MSTSHAMSSADAAWLHMDRPTNLMVINSVLWFDEPVDWDAYEAVIRGAPRGAVRPLSPASGREGVTGPHWEDVEVDLDLHVHRVALPAPGDRARSRTFVSDRVAMPLDRSRPLWEVYLIDGYGTARRAHADAPLHRRRDRAARVMLTLTDGGRRGR